MARFIPRRSFGGVLLLLGTAACGGGGGGSGNTLTLPAQFDRTGTVSSTGLVLQASDVESHDTGDGNANEVLRGTIAINLASVPAGASVESAVLNLVAASFISNPFGELGTLSVDHVDLGPSLDSADYAGGTLTAGIAVIAPYAVGVRNVAVDVTAAVRADLAAGRSSSCFRLAFQGAPSNDNAADLALFDCRLTDPSRQPSIRLVLN